MMPAPSTAAWLMSLPFGALFVLLFLHGLVVDEQTDQRIGLRSHGGFGEVLASTFSASSRDPADMLLHGF
jgi:hypothetical protein